MSIIREIILDIETTGLDPIDNHRIVEIGALEMHNKVITGKKFHFYINPERDMPNEAYRIHGISGEFLKNKPLFAEIAEDFLNFIADSKLVIHNAPFDIKFLNYELSILNKPSLDLCSTIDTLIVARRMFPGMRANLDALCKRFKIDNSGRKLHGALKDAVLLADIYIELTRERQVAFDITTKKQHIKINFTNKYLTISNKKAAIVVPTKEELKKHKEFLAKIISTNLV